MGDKATLEKAKKELEDLYLGVPDESVNLTFQDFAQVRQQHNAEKKKPEKSDKITSIPLAKLPSIDFKKGLEASFQSRPENVHHHRAEEGRPWGPVGHHHAYGHHQHQHQHHESSHHNGHDHHGNLHHNGDHHGHAGDQRSMVYDDMSHVSGMSVDYGVGRGGRRRPGIPHSNICTVCSTYVYICRRRCLVCGRVYCRQCVSMGMGEMTEGRKCIDCLGRRFSQRYIHKAGRVGCCMGYSSMVKQQELKWAEKGARRSGENRYDRNSVMMASRSRSPVGLSTPTRPLHSPANPPSFVMNSPTNHHPMPF